MVEITNVTIADIAPIEEIASVCRLARWHSSDYLNELSRPNSLFLKASRDNGICIGFIVGRIVPSISQGNGLDAEIYNIGVLPDSRNGGIGSRLMNSFLTECRERSVGAVWLEVRMGNEAAMGFYSKHEFGVIAVRKSFYNDPVEDAIVMRSKLYESPKLRLE